MVAHFKKNTFYKLNLFEVTHREKFQVVAKYPHSEERTSPIIYIYIYAVRVNNV